MREEGHYTLKSVNYLPKRGNANFLYYLRGADLEAFYRWDYGIWDTINIKGVGGAGASFKEVGTGLPNYDSAVDSFRTGKLGLGEPNPEEMLDIIGSPTTGGFKYDYTYGTGEIHRVQFGGENILSELGVPTGALKANLFDSFGIGAQVNIRAYFVTGDISASSGASGKLSSTMGVQNLANGHQNFVAIFPKDGGSGTEFKTRMAAQITSNEYSYATLSDFGDGVGYDEEPLAELLTLNTEGNSSGYTVNPHVFAIKNLTKLEDYGLGTFVVGYGHTDTSPLTGTGLTTIDSLAYNLGVDGIGIITEIPLDELTAGRVTKTAAPASAGSNGAEGDIRFDSSNIYVCIAPNSWKRTSIATWI